MEEKTNLTLEERLEKKRIELEKRLKKPNDFGINTFFIPDYKVANYFKLPMTNTEIEAMVANQFLHKPDSRDHP